MHKLEIDTIEKIAKTIILVPTAIIFIFFLFVLFSELIGKTIYISGNYLIISLLINIGILMLIYVSVYKFIITYRKTSKDNK
jgi:hypothetical protein